MTPSELYGEFTASFARRKFIAGLLVAFIDFLAELGVPDLQLSAFDLARHKGEPTGAAFQGVVFGFLRADNPHLQIEIGSVRTGSKRLQRVGDVDAWEGGG